MEPGRLVDETPYWGMTMGGFEAGGWLGKKRRNGVVKRGEGVFFCCFAGKRGWVDSNNHHSPGPIAIDTEMQSLSRMVVLDAMREGVRMGWDTAKTLRGVRSV